MNWFLRSTCGILMYLGCCSVNPSQCVATESIHQSNAYRGPVDLVRIPGQPLVVTANELSASVSLIDLTSKAVIQELRMPGKPASIAINEAGTIIVSCRDTGQISFLHLRDKQLVSAANVKVGFEPLGVAISRKAAYACLLATGEIVEIDLEKFEETARFKVGNWPRYCDVTPDGRRLAVGLSGDSEIAVVDLDSHSVLYREPISGGINIGHMAIGNDEQVYFPWMIYRSNPITVGNIRRGWVLASRLARIPMDGPKYREAIALDVPGEAVADPLGIGLSTDGEQIALSSSGTHELLLYKKNRLPFVGAGGPGDLIDRRLERDREGFSRIHLGGRPMGIEFVGDEILVANFLLDSVQLVSATERQVRGSIALGPAKMDEKAQLVHRGMEVFFDAERSLDQWYSCHSCHLDGRTNAKAMDTWNDGTELTAKSVLPLHNVTNTGPWTWHGWQNDLEASVQNSFVSTMQGKRGAEADVKALVTYLQSLELPPNPFLVDGQLSQAARRGQELFRSEAFGCSECHSGDNFTDGLTHDVGMIRPTDKYEGYNTPSLLGLYQKTRYLHDGRAKTLERVLTKYHRPDEIGGGAEPTDGQLADLIEYLKSL